MESVEKNECGDVLDCNYSEALYDDDERVHLKTGIDLRMLCDNKEEGVFLEPEFENNGSCRYEDKNYFDLSNEDAFNTYMETLRLDQDLEGDTDGVQDFDRMAKGMTPVSGSDGYVIKRINKTGLISQDVPPPKSYVTVHYSLFQENDEESFDSTVLRGRPERHKLDDGQLIFGLELALKSMHKREKATFIISPNYAYGPQGVPPRVEKNAKILAKIELIDYVAESMADAILGIPIEERSKVKTFDDIERAAQLEHIEGNECVKKKEWRSAVKRYDRGIKLLRETSLDNTSQEKRQRHLLLKLCLNCSHCCLKLNWPKKVCVLLREAIDLDPRNAKVFYRLARAKRMLGDNKEAMRHFMKARNLAPDDVTIGNEIISLQSYMLKERKDEQFLYSKMFGVKPASMKKSVKETPSLSSEESFDDDDEELLIEEDVVTAFINNNSKREISFDKFTTSTSSITAIKKIVKKYPGICLKEVDSCWKLMKLL